MDQLLVELASSSIHLTAEMLPPSSPDLASYIDPGTGTLVVQFLVAGLLGGAFMARSYWMRIGARLRRLFSRDGGRRD